MPGMLQRIEGRLVDKVPGVPANFMPMGASDVILVHWRLHLVATKSHDATDAIH